MKNNFELDEKIYTEEEKKRRLAQVYRILFGDEIMNFIKNLSDQDPQKADEYIRRAFGKCPCDNPCLYYENNKKQL